MQCKSHRILSTRPLDTSLIRKAADNNLVVEVQSLITIETITDEKLRAAIAELATKPFSVAITSINAAKAVVACLQGQSLNWKIFTIGTATGNYIAAHFGENSIAGTAENASSLADIIVDQQVKYILFFCGDQRRDELPEKLAVAEVEVLEIIVYRTLYTAVKTDRLYNGILFFSPGAVESFFSVNTVTQSTVLFAIGATTAGAIGTFSSNPVIISAVPAAEALVEKAINYFANTNTIHEGTTE